MYLAKCFGLNLDTFSLLGVYGVSRTWPQLSAVVNVYMSNTLLCPGLSLLAGPVLNCSAMHYG